MPEKMSIEKLIKDAKKLQHAEDVRSGDLEEEDNDMPGKGEWDYFESPDEADKLNNEAKTENSAEKDDRRGAFIINSLPPEDRE